jgi:hypothetical protein
MREKRKHWRTGFWRFVLSVLVVSLCNVTPAWSFTLGKTYDKSNAEEIKELLPESVYNMV